MDEKKVLKIEDEALQNVAGGQGDNEPSSDGSTSTVDIIKNYKDPTADHLTCPECGGDLNFSACGGKDYGFTIKGVCPHCNKEYSITV